MSATNRFAQRLMSIEGVEQIILTRNDGHVITHNVRDPDELSALAILSGITAAGVSKSMGFSPMNFLMTTRRSAGPFLVFPVDKYYLGVIQHPDATQQEMIEEIQHVLKQVVNQRKKSAAS